MFKPSMERDLSEFKQKVKNKRGIKGREKCSDNGNNQGKGGREL